MILTTRSLPRGIGWFGICYAVLTLVAVPAIFVGNGSMEVLLGGMNITAKAVVMFTCFVGSWMTRVKRETLAPTPRERQLQEVR